jgi:SpoIID/LytB domain protein
MFLAPGAYADDVELSQANELWWTGNIERAEELYLELSDVTGSGKRDSRTQGSAPGTGGAEAGRDRDPASTEIEARLQLAALYRSTGDLISAVSQYRILEALMDTPGVTVSDGERAERLYIPLGESLYYLHRLDEAEKALRLALNLDPNSPAALFGLGRVLFSRGALNEASSALHRSASLLPSFPGNYVYLARIAERQNSGEEALTQYREALDLDPQQAELLFPMGLVYESLGSFDDAFRQFHRLRNMDRDNPLVLARMDEIRPLLGAEEEKIIPVKTLGKFKPTLKVPGHENIPVLRIGLNTSAGGRGIPMRSMTFVADGPFRIVHGDSVLFRGKEQVEHRVSIEEGAAVITVADAEHARIPTGSFAVETAREDDATDRSGSIIIRRVEFARGYAWSGIEDRQYRGRIVARRTGKGFSLINEVNLEEYLYSVVPSEMPISFPEEALKAQAVVARTYALYRKTTVRPHRTHGYDLCDGQHCQVYRGAANEWERTIRAVDETRGQVLYYRSALTSPLFHGNCGGHTQSSKDLKGWGEVPYLTGVLDASPEELFPDSPAALEKWAKTAPEAYCSIEPFNSGPEYRWFRLIPADLLEEKLNRTESVGAIRRITVERRNPAGHAHRVVVSGEQASLVIEKEHEIRRFLGLGPLRSTLFWIETKYDAEGHPEEFLLFGGGWGHGVGMCQDGAGGMASLGMSYRDILSHYYRCTELGRLDY